MKKVTLLLGFLFVFGCQTPKQLTGDCKPDAENVLKSVTPLLIQEGFQITNSDSKIGYMNAETIPQMNILVGATAKKVWFISIQNGRIVAAAKVIMTTQNAFGASTGGSETYFDDTTSEDETWYWSIRRALEKVCENTLIVKDIKK